MAIFSNNQPVILIISKNSLISEEIQKQCQKQNIKYVSISAQKFENNLDFENQLTKIANIHNIDFIVNCAALTKNDKCVNNPEKAYFANSILPQLLSNICAKLDIKFIHLSTEAVFGSGQLGQLYRENDTPTPKTTYGITKRQGELNINPLCNFIIVRLPKLISPKKQLFSILTDKIRRGLEVEVAQDIYSTPISSFCATQKILEVILNFNDFSFQKIVHITGAKRLSLYQTLDLLFDKKMTNKIIPVSHKFFEPNPVEEPFLNGGLKSNFVKPIPFNKTFESFNIGEKNVSN